MNHPDSVLTVAYGSTRDSQAMKSSQITSQAAVGTLQTFVVFNLDKKRQPLKTAEIML
jgi:hypothetical protein